MFENPNVNQVNYKTKYILPPTGVGTANDPMKSVLLEAKKIEKNENNILLNVSIFKKSNNKSTNANISVKANNLLGQRGCACCE